MGCPIVYILPMRMRVCWEYDYKEKEEKQIWKRWIYESGKPHNQIFWKSESTSHCCSSQVCARRTHYSQRKGWIRFFLAESQLKHQVDVLTFNWNIDPPISATAIECKFSNSVGKSIAEALGQAVTYQLTFDRVIIATQREQKHEEISRWEVILSELGLGWISVHENGIVDIRKEPKPKHLFILEEYNKNVLPRLLLPLSFLHVFKSPIRYRRNTQWVHICSQRISWKTQYQHSNQRLVRFT